MCCRDGSICENCGNPIVENYGSGRFCSAYCARSFSTKATRKEINAKVSATNKRKFVEGTLFVPNFKVCSLEAKRKRVLGHKEYIEKTFGRWEDRKVNVGRGSKARGELTELDITNGELAEYRKRHPVCEICGKPERVSTNGGKSVAKLAVDHDHNDNKFRGLLCCDCNRKLGWYEALKDKIERYLALSSNGLRK